MDLNEKIDGLKAEMSQVGILLQIMNVKRKI